MELTLESKLSVSDIDHKYPNISHSFINEQLIKGIKVEMEHTDNPEVARKIALDHLHENPFYYEYLDKMEEELNSLDIDRHFQEIQTENYYARGGKLEAFEFNTPTGVESKLSYLQQVLVRTKSFKKWFGDWEIASRAYLLDSEMNFNKHFENVSKVMDMETLEPKVGFHGTSAEEEFYSFATNKETGAGRPYGYFAENREYSMNFVGKSNLLYAAFLNIRNPFIARGSFFTEKKLDWISASTAILGRMAADKFPRGSSEFNEEISRLGKVHESQIWGYIRKTYENENYNFWLLMARDFKSEFKNFLISHGYDGIFADEQFKDPYDAKDPRQFTNTFIVFDAAQVKLADGRNLTFNPMSADIRYEKGGIIAPNGKKSNLTPEQYKLVRTPQFKAWFGDWENDPQNASKIVDENGEPLVVYHGTEINFNVFSNKYNKNIQGFFFSSKVNNAKTYGNIVINAFLNIRRPYIIEANGLSFRDDIEIEVLAKYPNENSYLTNIEMNTDDIVYMIKNGKRNNEFIEIPNRENYDGVIFKNFLDQNLKSSIEVQQDTLVALYPSQIKLADGTNTTFNSKNDDIRYEKGSHLEMPSSPIEEFASAEPAPIILSKGGKMKEMLLPNKYKSGGALHNQEGVKDDAKEGGLFVGRSHATGGIKAYNVSTQQPIEVEGGEVIITKKAVDDGEKREFEGEMLTNKEILSRINESGGGVSFADGGEVHGCGCSGKKYNYGGETLEDYLIIKKMNDAYDMSFGKSVKYVNSLIEKLK